MIEFKCSSIAISWPWTKSMWVGEKSLTRVLDLETGQIVWMDHGRGI